MTLESRIPTDANQPGREYFNDEILFDAYNSTLNVEIDGLYQGKRSSQYMTGVHIGGGLVVTTAHGLEKMDDYTIRTLDNQHIARGVADMSLPPRLDLLLLQLSQWSGLSQVEVDSSHQFRPLEKLLVTSYPDPSPGTMFGYMARYLGEENPQIDESRYNPKTDVTLNYSFSIKASDRNVILSGIYRGASGSGVFTPKGLVAIVHSYSEGRNQLGCAMRLS